MSFLMYLLSYATIISLAILFFGIAIGWIWRRLSGSVGKRIGPVKDDLNITFGNILEARQWHAAGGGFHAEFWVRDTHGVEHRYKVENIHPEVRRNQNVSIYEYSGHLCLIKNQSTGKDIWYVPDRLLRRLYPSVRNPMIPITALLVVASVIFLEAQGDTILTILLIMLSIGSAVLVWDKEKKNYIKRVSLLNDFFGRALGR